MKKYMLLQLFASSLIYASAALYVTPDDLQEHIDNKNKTTLQHYITHPRLYLFTDLDTSAKIIQTALLARQVSTSEDTKQELTLEQAIQQLPQNLRTLYDTHRRLYETTKKSLKNNKSYIALLDEANIFPVLTWSNISQTMLKIRSAQKQYEGLTDAASSEELTKLGKYLEKNTKFLDVILDYMTENINMAFQNVQEVQPIVQSRLRTWQGTFGLWDNTHYIRDALKKAAEHLAPTTYKMYTELNELISKNLESIHSIVDASQPKNAEDRFKKAQQLCQLITERKQLIERFLALRNRALFFNIDAFQLCVQFNNTDRSSSLKTDFVRCIQNSIFIADWNKSTPVSSIFATNHHKALLQIIQTVNSIVMNVLQAPEFELDSGKERLYFVYNPKNAYIIYNSENLIDFLQTKITNSAAITAAQEVTTDLAEIQRLFEDTKADSLEQLPKILTLFEKVYKLTHNPIDPAMKDQLVRLYNQAVRQAFDKAYRESLQMAVDEKQYIQTLLLGNKKNATTQFNDKMAKLSQMMRDKKDLFINPSLPETEFMDKTDPKKFQI